MTTYSIEFSVLACQWLTSPWQTFRSKYCLRKTLWKIWQNCIWIFAQKLIPNVFSENCLRSAHILNIYPFMAQWTVLRLPVSRTGCRGWKLLLLLRRRRRGRRWEWRRGQRPRNRRCENLLEVAASLCPTGSSRSNDSSRQVNQCCRKSIWDRSKIDERRGCHLAFLKLFVRSKIWPFLTFFMFKKIIVPFKAFLAKLETPLLRLLIEFWRAFLGLFNQRNLWKMHHNAENTCKNRDWFWQET